MTPEPFFHLDGDVYVPTGHARGPWDDRFLHGGAPTGLIARELGRIDTEPMTIARITYEFLGPVPLAPLTVGAQVVKPGRRFQIAEAELAPVGGTPVVKARAVRLRCGDVPVPDDARGPGPDAVPGGADPDAYESEPGVLHGEATEAFHVTGMELRFPRGTFRERGPATTWFRPRRPLVDAEPIPPVARAVMAADFGNGISRVLDFATHMFVNTDLTIHLHREPVGEWILLDSTTAIDPSGAGIAQSQLYDTAGAIGIGAQSLFVEAR